MLVQHKQNDAFYAASGISMSDLQLIFAATVGALIFTWFVNHLMNLHKYFGSGVLSEVGFLLLVLRATTVAILMTAFISYLMTT